MGASDDDSDDANLEADAELNRKVATVVAPLVKKLKRQREKIDQLEEELKGQKKEQGDTLPRMQQSIDESKKDLAEALERTRRDLGDRVLNTDYSKLEVGLKSKVEVMETITEDLRTRLAQQEILAKHNCPYLVRGYFAFRSMHHIYFALEFLPGGDLLAMLRNCGCVPEEMARFYLAEVIRIDR